MPGILVAVGGGLALLLLILLVSLALTALATLIRRFAFRACVLEGLGIFDALGASIALTRTRLREALLMWLLLLAINAALALLFIPLGLMGIGGIIGPAFATFRLTGSIGAAALSGLPVLLVIFLVGVFVGGVYVVFSSAAWTLTFRELRGKRMLAEAS